MPSFTLGTEAGDHLIVEINGRPDERDDWVSAKISVHTGAFSALIQSKVNYKSHASGTDVAESSSVTSR